MIYFPCVCKNMTSKCHIQLPNFENVAWVYYLTRFWFISSFFLIQLFRFHPFICPTNIIFLFMYPFHQSSPLPLFPCFCVLVLCAVAKWMHISTPHCLDLAMSASAWLQYLSIYTASLCLIIKSYANRSTLKGT